MVNPLMNHVAGGHRGERKAGAVRGLWTGRHRGCGSARVPPGTLAAG